jgi:hypothetical protein
VNNLRSNITHGRNVLIIKTINPVPGLVVELDSEGKFKYFIAP